MLNPRQIEIHFNKSFKFVNNQQWSLPTEAYKVPPWKIEALQEMKVKLNTVKGQLSKFNLDEWSEYTRYRDPSSFIISSLKTKTKIELLTQAWCKFYECLNRYPIIPKAARTKHKLTSLHLCEAPGGFISALNCYLYTHYRQISWNWCATTLNPYYEGNDLSKMITDDRLIKFTSNNWDFGLDQSGDLTKFYNHEALVQKSSEVLLVTADGSVDCMSDPGEQENNVYFLHYCEVMTALKVLQPQGSFVLKLFTMFEHSTICLLYLLCHVFEEVNVFKPCASKSGNSEVYLICLGYKGMQRLSNLWKSLIAPYQGFIQPSAMFALSEIDVEFLKQLEECAAFFMDLQSLKINDNVKCFMNTPFVDCEEIDELKWHIAKEYIKRYPVALKIPKKRKLAKRAGKMKFKYVENSNNCVNVFFPDNFDNLLNIKIGKTIDTVAATQFCTVDINSLFQSSAPVDIILQELEEYLPNGFTLIQRADFQEHLSHSVFQRNFFCLLKIQLLNSNNLVIIGIPVLTKFLVGILFILGLSFEFVLIKNHALVFYNASQAQRNFIKNYFDVIDSIFNNLETKHFVSDILEVVPSEYLCNGDFYNLICNYNNGLLWP